MKTIRSVLIFLLILALIFLVAPGRSVRAANVCTWSGAVSANWSVPGNWGPGCGIGVPGTGDDLIFPSGPSTLTMNDDLPAISLGQLSFTGSGYTLNGANTISLSTGIDVEAGVQAVNAPLAVLNSSVVFLTASGTTLTFGGTVALSTFTLTTTVNGTAGVTGMTFQGLITGGPDPLTRGKIAKNGTGNLRFSANDDSLKYWDIDLNAGTISTDLAASTYLPYYGIITLASGTDLNLLNSGVIGTIAGAGNIHASSFYQVREYHNSTFTGDLFGSNQFALVGDGHLTIDRGGGTLSYTGEFNLNAGPTYMKLVNTNATAASDFLLNDSHGGAVLELDGSQVGLVKLGYSGTPGSVGILKLSGPTPNSVSQVVAQTSGSAVVSVMNSTADYGRTTETLPMDLGGLSITFSFSGSANPVPGFPYEVIHNTNSGTAIKNGATFTGLAQGGVLQFNQGALFADYQAQMNTAFTLTGAWRLFLPLIVK